MLGCNHAIRSSRLSRQWQRSLSHPLCRSYYDPRKIDPTQSPCSSRDDHPSPSSTLPVSPFLDQHVVNAKRRLNFKFQKPRQNAAPLTDFQKRLATNPYAHALASPVRSCTFSSARVPQHFLLPFVTQFRSGQGLDKSDKLVPHVVLRTENHSPGPATSIINSRSLLRRLGKKKTWQRLVSRDVQDKYGIKDKRDWKWPDDVESLALQHLRHASFAKLKWAFKMPKANLVRPLNALPGAPSCILVLRNSTAPDVDSVETPLLNLVAMLGEDLVRELVQDTEFADSHAVALGDSPQTTSIRVRLLKLKHFLDDDDDIK